MIEVIVFTIVFLMVLVYWPYVYYGRPRKIRIVRKVYPDGDVKYFLWFKFVFIWFEVDDVFDLGRYIGLENKEDFYSYPCKTVEKAREFKRRVEEKKKRPPKPKETIIE